MIATPFFAPVQASIIADAFAFIFGQGPLSASSPAAAPRAPAAQQSTARLIPARIRRPPALAPHGQTVPKTLRSPIAKTSTAPRPKKAERRRSDKKRYTAVTTPKAEHVGAQTKLALGSCLSCNQGYLNAICSFKDKATPAAPETPSGRFAGLLHKALKL